MRLAASWKWVSGTGRSKEQRRRLEERARARSEAAAVSVPETADVAIIGGGASGLVAAIAAARAGAVTVLLETADEVGLPILATGNGRCNLANVDLSPTRYNAPDFVGRVMGAHPLEAILELFGELGLIVEEEEAGRLYPRSRQAASVRNLLVAEARRAGAVMAPLREVTGLGHETRGPDAPVWTVRYRDRSRTPRTGTASTPADRTLGAKSVVLATGGGTGALAEALGVPMVPTRPALCGLACESSPLDVLDGRRMRALVHLEAGDRTDDESGAPARRGDPSHPFRPAKAVPSEQREAGWNSTVASDDDRPPCLSSGEVLFRDGGLTGPPILDLSRFAEAGDRLLVDLIPDRSHDEVLGAMTRHLDERGRPTSIALDGLIDPVVGRTIIGLAGEGWPVPADSVLESAAALSKGLPFLVTGRIAAHAQVTQGGIALDAIDPETMAVTSGDAGEPLPMGLFATGEVLDVDGPCGGYNLSFAWLSGLRAGRMAARVAHTL